MKKMKFLVLALFAFTGLVSSCDKDESLDLPSNPTIEVSVDQEGDEFMPGTMLTFTIKAAPVDGILSQLVITPSIAGGSSNGLSSHVYNTTEDVTYMYEVPYEGGASVSVNFAVTAVNEGDINLKTTTATDVIFSITNSFTEVHDVRLYSLYGDESKKSLLRFDDGSTYSYTESFEGDDALKLALDIYSYVKITEVDGVSTTKAMLAATGAVMPGETALMNLWGDGDWKPHRRHTSTPEGFTLYNQLDYNAFNPEDIFTSYGSGIEVQVGDVITFDNAAIGGYNPDGDALTRINPDVIGAIKITEINEGTIGDGSDGYIVFSYKYVNK